MYKYSIFIGALTIIISLVIFIKTIKQMVEKKKSEWRYLILSNSRLENVVIILLVFIVTVYVVAFFIGTNLCIELLLGILYLVIFICLLISKNNNILLVGLKFYYIFASAMLFVVHGTSVIVDFVILGIVQYADMWCWGYLISLILWISCFYKVSKYIYKNNDNNHKKENILLCLMLVVIMEFMVYFIVGIFVGSEYYPNGYGDGDTLDVVMAVISNSLHINDSLDMLYEPTKYSIGCIYIRVTDKITELFLLGNIINMLVDYKSD